jgi:hypothetical protein
MSSRIPIIQKILGIQPKRMKGRNRRCVPDVKTGGPSSWPEIIDVLFPTMVK